MPSNRWELSLKTIMIMSFDLCEEIVYFFCGRLIAVIRMMMTVVITCIYANSRNDRVTMFT